MKNAHRNKKGETFPNLHRRYQQDIAYQHLFDFLVALRSAAEQQHRRGRGHDVGDADDGFLRNFAGAFSGDGKDGAAENGEGQRNGKSDPAVKIEPKE